MRFQNVELNFHELGVSLKGEDQLARAILRLAEWSHQDGGELRETADWNQWQAYCELRNVRTRESDRAFGLELFKEMKKGLSPVPLHKQFGLDDNPLPLIHLEAVKNAVHPTPYFLLKISSPFFEEGDLEDILARDAKLKRGIHCAQISAVLAPVALGEYHFDIDVVLAIITTLFPQGAERFDLPLPPKKNRDRLMDDIITITSGPLLLRVDIASQVSSCLIEPDSATPFIHHWVGPEGKKRLIISYGYSQHRPPVVVVNVSGSNENMEWDAQDIRERLENLRKELSKFYILRL